MNIGAFFGWLFGPTGLIGAPFHYLFYLPVFNVLMGIYLLVHNFALAIVILTILIRVCLIPLTRAQLKSSQEMQRIAPQLRALQQQYRGDPQRLMAEQQALYREHGVSPYKGCLPLFVQLPFLYALYYSFFNVLSSSNAEKMLHNINDSLYPFMPHFSLSTLPSTHFLWTNLAHADPLHILPIIAGVLTFIQLRMAMPVKRPQPRGAQPDSMQAATNTTMYIMPFFTVFIGWTFPSGLALYWCISTLFSAVQQYFIGGWGSLFVGIPGMERFVPPPKDLTSITPAPAVAARAGGRGQIASATPAAAPSGGGGFLQRLRDSLAAAQSAQRQAAETAAPTTAVGNGAEPKSPRPPRPPSASANLPRDRRTRPAREAPMLVKPPTGPTEGSATLPEDEIARAGGSSIKGKPVLPEQAIARDASGGDQINEGGAGRAAKTNGVNGARPSGEPGYRKGPQPGPNRPRGGRPKGGR